MGAVFVALLSVAAFAVVLARTKIAAVVGRLPHVATTGVSAMFDTALDDLAKERAVRRAGLDLVKGGWQIIWRFGIALGTVALPIMAADFTGLVPRAASLAMLMRVDFLVIVSVLAIVAAVLASRLLRPTGDTAIRAPQHSAGDQLIHALAFSGPGTLRWLARLDDRLFARRIRTVNLGPPIFITSLARGGTTALVNALHALPGVATHLYADMPFITAPLLWSKLGGRSRAVTERPRAHGDGMQISLRSPEAFDEVFWQLFWPEKYRAEQILLWSQTDIRPAAQGFFQRQFKKIAVLRRPRAVSLVRYLSKNNANIARLDLLPLMFPGCSIIVPVRHPAAHAASLHRQHLNFSRLHADDPFALRYMRDIGHFEFGKLHKAIDFTGSFSEGRNPEQPDYWLAYWIAAMEDISRHATRVLIVTQDDIRAAPQATMDALTARLGLEPVTDAAQYFRATPDIRPIAEFDAALLDRATALYDRLAQQAVR